MSSSSTENSKKINGNAREPFNEPESSDTIFRTSDGVEFHIHRIILFLASPFFRDMFSLPQPSAADTKPIIDVSESSTVLDPLLRLCYPVDDPEFTGGNIGSLTLLGETLEAALKYQLTVATKILKGHLRSFINDHPLCAYAIACRLQLEDEASLAAHRWRDSRPDLVTDGDGRIFPKGCYMDWKNTVYGASYVQEMSDISAGAYYRLIQFVRTGNKSSFCIRPMSKSWLPVFNSGRIPNNTVSNDFNFPDYDISVISSDHVEFRVHHIILRLASSKLLENMTTDQSGKKTVWLPEDSYTLSPLLAACYPARGLGGHGLDVSDLLSLLLAAQKYEMPSTILKAVNALLTARMHVDPLRIYLAFAQNGCYEDAAHVARNTLFQKPFSELYVPEIEDFTADYLYHLLEYRHQCLSSVTRICAQYENDSSFESSDTEFNWGYIFPNYLVPTTKNLSLSGPVVQRELVRLQEQCRQYCNDVYNYKKKGNRPSQPFILEADLKKLHEESKQLEEELNTELSNLKIKPSYDRVYIPVAPNFTGVKI